jgi:predicted HicB family RNase H-like nuclease
MTNLNVIIEEKLHTELKIFAVSRRMKLNKIVSKAIAEYLKNHDMPEEL